MEVGNPTAFQITLVRIGIMLVLEASKEEWPVLIQALLHLIYPFVKKKGRILKLNTNIMKPH